METKEGREYYEDRITKGGWMSSDEVEKLKHLQVISLLTAKQYSHEWEDSKERFVRRMADIGIAEEKIWCAMVLSFEHDGDRMMFAALLFGDNSWNPSDQAYRAGMEYRAGVLGIEYHHRTAEEIINHAREFLHRGPPPTEQQADKLKDLCFDCMKPLKGEHHTHQGKFFCVDCIEFQK